MAEEWIKEYAKELLLAHARDIEYLSIFEMAEEYLDGEEISDEEARKVDDLLSKATITVSWDDD